MPLWWKSFLIITQHIQFIVSFKCILTALTEKTGLSPFMRVSPLITLSLSVSRWGFVEMIETSKLLCSAFTLRGCREVEEGRKMLSANSVENNEGGRLLQWGAAVLNMENHMQSSTYTSLVHHSKVHRASLQSKHLLYEQRTWTWLMQLTTLRR